MPFGSEAVEVTEIIDEKDVRRSICEHGSDFLFSISGETAADLGEVEHHLVVIFRVLDELDHETRNHRERKRLNVHVLRGNSEGGSLESVSLSVDSAMMNSSMKGCAAAVTTREIGTENENRSDHLRLSELILIT